MVVGRHHPDGGPETSAFRNLGTYLETAVGPVTSMLGAHAPGRILADGALDARGFAVCLQNEATVLHPDILGVVGVNLKLVVAAAEGVDLALPLGAVEGVAIEVVGPDELEFSGVHFDEGMDVRVALLVRSVFENLPSTGMMAAMKVEWPPWRPGCSIRLRNPPAVCGRAWCG